ncbi:MAG: (d)CMP kinase [Bdellovibrionales bacterium]
MSKPVIAVDGPAASGKGTVARKLAEELNFAYMDTGILYRAVAFEVIDSGLSIKDKRDCIDAAKIFIKKLKNPIKNKSLLNNPRLRDDDIGNAASKIATIQDIRNLLNTLQKDFAKNPGIAYKGAVLDGRDIGTIICPNADLKLFITAETEIRSRRRLKELHSKGIAATYGSVLDDMRARDKRDSERNNAPMTQAKDAIIIDNSDLNAEETLEKALEITKERLSL